MAHFFGIFVVVQWYPLVKNKIVMEKGLFIDDLPFKDDDFPVCYVE